MKHNLLLAVALCFTVAIHATDVKYCDKKKDYSVKVSGIDINPYPISRGKPITFAISASSDDAITDGKMVIDVSYFGWHVHSETHNLCEETSCPMTGGDFVVSHSQSLPGITPPGSYSLTMKMYDGKKNELTCINFGFDIGFLADA